MSETTKPLKLATGGKPAPQVWNPTGGIDGLGDYEYLKGKYGAPYSILLGANGSPLRTRDNTKLDVASTEIEAALATLAALVGEVGVSPTANTLLARLKDLLIEMQGGLDVQVASSTVTAITFHDAAVAPADGAPLAVGGLKTLTVEIWGTSTSRTVEFKAAGPEGTYRLISGVRLSDLTIATSTTGTAEFWQFDITGLAAVIMDLSAVAGGNVTVKGRAVA